MVTGFEEAQEFGGFPLHEVKSLGRRQGTQERQLEGDLARFVVAIEL